MEPKTNIEQPLIPGDLRLRTPRSARAQNLGRNFLNHKKGTERDFVCDMPLLFGITLPLEKGTDTNLANGVPIELDPEKHGFIALAEAPSSEDSKLLRSLLLVGELGTIPFTAKAYKNQPVKTWGDQQAIFYRTELTDSDGLVWFETIDKNDKRLLGTPRLMIFPQESLISAEDR